MGGPPTLSPAAPPGTRERLHARGAADGGRRVYGRPAPRVTLARGAATATAGTAQGGEDTGVTRVELRVELDELDSRVRR